jgi:hypothetical protein
LHSVLTDQDIAGTGEIITNNVTGPIKTCFTSVSCRPARGIYQQNLSVAHIVIERQKLI